MKRWRTTHGRVSRLRRTILRAMRRRFFGAQVSSGITFVQTNEGPRAYGMTAQFYLAPMERATSPGMTWYVFSAQRGNAVTPGASAHFNLPTSLQGAQAEFYWAVGAVRPFAWV